MSFGAGISSILAAHIRLPGSHFPRVPTSLPNLTYCYTEFLSPQCVLYCFCSKVQYVEDWIFITKDPVKQARSFKVIEKVFELTPWSISNVWATFQHRKTYLIEKDLPCVCTFSHIKQFRTIAWLHFCKILLRWNHKESIYFKSTAEADNVASVKQKFQLNENLNFMPFITK